MERGRVQELHFITPISNLESVLRHGILSHNAARRLPHLSVADEDVQSRRRQKRVPGGMQLHDYANLYFDARNPMMYRIKGNGTPLAVVCVNPSILDLPGVVITDGNAASDGTRFAASPGGIAILDEGLVYAHSWTSSDRWDYIERKRARCAEVLVPNCVDPSYIDKAKVIRQSHVISCHAAGLRGEVFANVFFA
ncbi:DUF4433 domain-containing protein [Micromonospora aurantiaca (nom. illeg.)]|uniref:DUF4433 domain-containing protein n=1 Tax=Micromonospora aurantiaca (nom. illeg.) TaxID=47850 RepID=UPI0001DF72DB|nr:hypothetical protein Micau_0029 [Micromonospora aurantiaca ATCC 27029]